MNASKSHERSSGVEKLPEELWSIVFTYLKVEDRKNVRLACRYFYAACNQSHIQKSEAIAFYDNIVDVYSTLQRLSQTRRELWNIKLKKMYLMDPFTLSFFSIQGQYIHSLIFDKCTLEPGILLAILKCSVNLRNFELVINQKPVGLQALKWIVADFDTLRKDGIVREKVESFTLKHEPILSTYSTYAGNKPKPLMSNKNLLLFFDVFPKIRDLNVAIAVDQNFNQFSTISSDIMSDEVLSFSSIHFLVSKMRHQLEKLKLAFLYNFDKSYLTLQLLTEISLIQCDNLKELSLNWIDLWDTYVIDPLLPFHNLTHFDFYIGPKMRIAASDFVRLLLHTAPELNLLTIRSGEQLQFDYECFRALLKSKLKTLNIYSSKSLFASVGSTNRNDPFRKSSLPPNYNLKHLRTTEFGMRTDDLLSFCKHFQRLETLQVDKIDVHVLRHIIKYQSHLVRLTMSSSKESLKCVDSLLLQLRNKNLWWWYRRREHMTHLHIKEAGSYDLSLFMLSQFDYPVLKTLILDLKNCGPADTEYLWLNILKLTNLECLLIDWPFETALPRWLALLTALPKLRYVRIWDRCSNCLLDDSEYRQFFQMNSSLRLLTHLGAITMPKRHILGVQKYVRDEERKMVRKTVIQLKSIKFGGIPDHYLPEGNLAREDISYRCHVCNNEVSISTYNFKNHWPCHIREKPFDCDICGKTFQKEDDLVQHAHFHPRSMVRLHHKIRSMRTHTLRRINNPSSPQ